MTPQFTIVTPVLNMAEFIGRCIRSVQNQDVTLEHIIIDGGSTDGTLDVIEELRNGQTTLVSEPDRGQSDAINKGLRLAKGKWFNWLNADDEFTPNALEVVAKSSTQQVDVIAGKCVHVANEKTIAIGRTRAILSAEKTIANYQMGQPSHFYRTSAIRGLNGLNINLELAMDMDLWIRYVLKYGTSKVKLVNEILSRFHLHPTSKSVDRSGETDSTKFGIFLAILERLNTPSWITDEVEPLADLVSLEYDTSSLNSEIFLSEFAYRLMQPAYERGDLKTASRLFDLVVQSERLSKPEELEWRIRTKGTSAKLIKTLRGK